MRCIAWQLRLLEVAEWTPGEVRQVVTNHARDLAGAGASYSTADAEGAISVVEMLASSMASWPETARQGLEPSHEAWVELMQRETTYADGAFVALAGDYFNVVCTIISISPTGEPLDEQVVRPPRRPELGRGEPSCAVRLVLTPDDHYVSLVRKVPAAPARRCETCAWATNEGRASGESEGDDRAPSPQPDTDPTQPDTSTQPAPLDSRSDGDEPARDSDEGTPRASAAQAEEVRMGDTTSGAEARPEDGGPGPTPQGTNEPSAADTERAPPRAKRRRARGDEDDGRRRTKWAKPLVDAEATVLVISAKERRPCDAEEGGEARRLPRAPVTMPSVARARSERRPPPPDAEHALQWPISDVGDFAKLLRSEHAPTELVVFEFSGALREARRRRGYRALSVDLRDSEVPGPHYKGDVRDIIHMAEWEIVFFVGPNCFQTMRRDNCLANKIEDGRAFWGVAVVLWCICCAYARAVVVEQPDTIALDYVNEDTLAGVSVHHLRTSMYGDAPDKYIRLTTRGVWIPPPPEPNAPRPEQKRAPHWTYGSDDERDRARSTWAPYHNMCASLARARPLVEVDAAPLDYAVQIEVLAETWRAEGRPLPVDYHNHDAQPTSEDERAYQRERGAGRGRTSRSSPTAWATQEGRGGASVAGGAHTLAGQGGDPPSPLKRNTGERDVVLLPAGEDAAGTAVVAFDVTQDEPLVLMPDDSESVVTLAPESSGEAELPKVEQALQRLDVTSGDVVAYRCARRDSERRLIAAATTSARRASVAIGAMTLVWVALSALPHGGAQSTLAHLAVYSAVNYMARATGTTAAIQAEAMLHRRTGWRPGRSDVHAPIRTMIRDGATITPRDLIPRAVQGLAELKSEILARQAEAPWLSEWADVAAPLQLGDVPSDLLDEPLPLWDDGLKGALFSRWLNVYELPWLARKPPQRWEHRVGCETYQPRSVRDLLTDGGWARVEKWLVRVRADLRCLQEHGEECGREDRPGAIAVGQDEFNECAQGYVWDCRAKERCVLLDYDAPTSTRLNIPYLREKFKGYPDQRLASYLIEGVRLEADVELQLVLMPPLQSIGEGFDSVQTTVRELAGEGFYDFYSAMPFAPSYVISQGSRVKKAAATTERPTEGDGATWVPKKKYRRTSNFSAPHKRIRDGAGVPVIAINDASRCYYVPEWIAKSRDADLRRWSEQRYDHVPQHVKEQNAQHPAGEEGGGAPRQKAVHKFPKEQKPSVQDLARDAAILLRAAVELDQNVYVWVNDAAFYFNQLAYAPEELAKSTLVTGALAGDVNAHGESMSEGDVVFVSETRLGFGSFASSNICQRFSNAYVEWIFEEFDEMEAASDGIERDAATIAWREGRSALHGRCREERPKRKGQALTDCRQDRLAVMHMYQDDPITIVVGRGRALRMMEAQHRVTERIRLIMADASKRQIGGHVEWIGLLALVAIGVVAVTRSKLIRAHAELEEAVKHRLDFGRYRAMVGLLEHLRFVAGASAALMAPLYKPHGPRGESKDGPGTIVHPDAEMHQTLDEWRALIKGCGGTLVTSAHVADGDARIQHAHEVYAISADAAGDGRGTPGMGGYMHGHVWRVPLPPHVVACMHITAWELLATVLNVLVFGRLAPPAATLAARADALLVPYVLESERSDSEDVRFILGLLTECPRYSKHIAHRVTVQHLAGELNLPADLTSRGLWGELDSLAAVLKVELTRVPLQRDEARIVRAVLHRIADRAEVPITEDDIEGVLRAAHLIGKEYSCSTDGDGPAARAEARSDADAAYGTQSPGGGQREAAEGRTDPQVGPSSSAPLAQEVIRYGGHLTSFMPPRAARRAAARLESVAKARESVAVEPSTRGFRPPRAQRRDAHTAPERSTEGDRDEARRAEPPEERARKRQRFRDVPKRALRPDEVEDYRELARRLHEDRTEGRIEATYEELEEWARAIAEARADGVNPRTASKNDFAWKEWRRYAALRGFDPNLKSHLTQAFPERETVKLSGYLLFRMQRIKPRSKKDAAAKPMSAYQNYLALRRVFHLKGVALPPSAAVRETLRGVIRRHIQRHGIASLRPRRVEPITPAIVQRAFEVAERGDQRVLGRRWHPSEWACFITMTWMEFNLPVGLRKGETTRLPGDESQHDWLNRSNVTYRIAGRTIDDPTEEQLRSMRAGDVVRVAPNGAKCDQYGTCYGTDPIVLPFSPHGLNSARAIRDMELRRPCRGADRATFALFGDEDGAPYSDSTFAGLVNGALEITLGRQRAQAYSPHSWRVFLATAARLSNADDGTIQALGRWMTPESVRIYARMSVEEYARWVERIMGVHHIDATRTVNLPAMDVEDVLRPLEPFLHRRETTARPGRTDAFDAEAMQQAPHAVRPTKLKKGTRIKVYWTDLDEWYTATTGATRTEMGDDGHPQLIHCVLYDAVGPWQRARDLKYWHCLDDVNWQHEDGDGGD